MLCHNFQYIKFKNYGQRLFYTLTIDSIEESTQHLFVAAKEMIDNSFLNVQEIVTSFVSNSKTMSDLTLENTNENIDNLTFQVDGLIKETHRFLHESSEKISEASKRFTTNPSEAISLSFEDTKTASGEVIQEVSNKIFRLSSLDLTLEKELGITMGTFLLNGAAAVIYPAVRLLK